MWIARLLFSFRGRLARDRFWLGYLLAWLAAVVPFAIPAVWRGFPVFPVALSIVGGWLTTFSLGWGFVFAATESVALMAVIALGLLISLVAQLAVFTKTSADLLRAVS
jgi:uncharacterized membrane protein YhaH (DUF805 family)